jgi:prepilin-type N-terminal cleavage/methylation domain-containing protein
MGSCMRRRLVENARADGGFTLVELLVASAMVLVVLGGAGTMIVVTSKQSPRIADRSGDIQAAMVFQERIGREIRQGYRILNATPSSLELYTYRRVAACASTTPLASSAPAIACRVTYSCATDGTCTRSETDPAGTLAPRVEEVATGLMSNAIFSYSPDATAPEYVTVRISLEAERGDDSVTLEDGFELRNR